MAIHRFTPERYYNTLGSYAPVLEIDDGDSVVTTTVDARGYDADERPVTPPGNPQTGPFFIRGARPGDSLEVVFDRLWPNRRTGWSRTRLAPNVVDPGSIISSGKEDPLARWDLDLEKGIATLTTPRTALGQIALPFRPMPGCFGVAPEGGQAISTATSGPHGGNMDYNGFVAGVRIFLPVSVEGALFFVGDGHALQGDGEIVGTGIETSFDVQFTVRVHSGERISWPRFTNKTHIGAVGNARPLDQAMQHATTEMATWLQEEYGLDRTGAHILMGQCIQYDIGNVFDPAYTVVCRLPCDIMSGLFRA